MLASSEGSRVFVATSTEEYGVGIARLLQLYYPHLVLDFKVITPDNEFVDVANFVRTATHLIVDFDSLSLGFNRLVMSILTIQGARGKEKNLNIAIATALLEFEAKTLDWFGREGVGMICFDRPEDWAAFLDGRQIPNSVKLVDRPILAK